MDLTLFPKGKEKPWPQTDSHIYDSVNGKKSIVSLNEVYPDFLLQACFGAVTTAARNPSRDEEAHQKE